MRGRRACENLCTFCFYLDSSLGDADGLLLHGFVDGHLVFEVHLVKLVNAAHALRRQKQTNKRRRQWTPTHPTAASASPNTHVVSEHQSPGLDHKLVGLLVSDHGRRQTRGAAGLAAGVNRPGAELLHVPAKWQAKI